MLKFELNSDAVIARFLRKLDRTKLLSGPMDIAGAIVRDGAKQRIKDQGGDQEWPPNKRGGHTGILNGLMMNSISSHTDGDGVVVKAVVGTVFRYARWFQEGTGIYAGHSAWTIRPVNKKALAFNVGGERVVVREVTMPGQPPRPFLLVTAVERKRIAAAFRLWITRGSLQGGNE